MEDLDVAGVRRLWSEVSPHLPQPTDDADALATCHLARTATRSMPFPLRAYSHQWLLERGLASLLPDELKPKAQRMYPVVVTAVGVASRSRHREVKQAVQGAMLYAVQEAEADGRLLDSPYVRTRIREARLRERRALFGRFDNGEEHPGQDFRDITGG
jgi:hypothetical protein